MILIREFLTEVLSFNILPWEMEWLEAVYGPVDSTGTRMVQRAYLSIGRGNGKTSFAAACALYHLLADDEPQAACVLAASSREQAGYAFKEVQRLIDKTKGSKYDLSLVLHQVPSKKQIHYPKKDGLLKAISADNKAPHGDRISFLLFDELHCITDVSYHSALLYGTSKGRKQPLTVYTTTAGYDKGGLCYNILQMFKANTANPRLHLQVYEAEENDDPSLPETWRKANPSLGAILTEDQMQVDYDAAKLLPSDMADFKRTKLNIWTQSKDSYIDLAAYDRCMTTYPELKGLPCHVGIDLSGGGGDLTGLVWVIPHEGRFYTFAHAWTTTAALERRDKSNRFSYRAFIDRDELEVEDGNVIAYSKVRDKIEEIHKTYPVASITWDKWGSNESAQVMMEKGFECHYLQPYPNHQHEPTKRLERLIMDGKLAHDGNNLLRWSLGNCQAVKQDQSIKISKEKSSDKIDVAQSLINALFTLKEDQQPTEPSMLETTGILWV